MALLEILLGISMRMHQYAFVISDRVLTDQTCATPEVAKLGRTEASSKLHSEVSAKARRMTTT